MSASIHAQAPGYQRQKAFGTSFWNICRQSIRFATHNMTPVGSASFWAAAFIHSLQLISICVPLSIGSIISPVFDALEVSEAGAERVDEGLLFFGGKVDGNGIHGCRHL